MYKHLENIEYLYGDAHVQIPNGIFSDLSKDSKNIQQTSFAYAYVVTIAFLYKYAQYIDIDNGTYIQNADIKELLGYNRVTKTVDPIIKKGGMLDKLGLTTTIKDYPIRFVQHPTETINDIPLREFVHISDIDDTDVNYNIIKGIVKNRNYTVKEPSFFFGYKDESGTLYDYSNTHRVTLKELMKFLKDGNLNNIDFLLYCFFKSNCYGLKDNSKTISLNIITSHLDIGYDAFYRHLEVLKDNKLIAVNHRGWVMDSKDSIDSNEYYFKGVK